MSYAKQFETFRAVIFSSVFWLHFPYIQM